MAKIGHQSFTFIGTAEFSGAAGELRYEIVNGNTLLQMQTNQGPDPDIALTMIGVYTLTAADFLL